MRPIQVQLRQLGTLAVIALIVIASVVANAAASAPRPHAAQLIARVAAEQAPSIDCRPAAGAGSDRAEVAGR